MIVMMAGISAGNCIVVVMAAKVVVAVVAELQRMCLWMKKN